MYKSCISYIRYMRTPERLTALKVAKHTLRIRDQKITSMKKKLDSLTSQKGVAVDNYVQKELEDVICDKKSEIESLPISDFRRIFWEQQVSINLINLIILVSFLTTVGCNTETERQARNALAPFVFEMVLEYFKSISKSI